MTPRYPRAAPPLSLRPPTLLEKLVGFLLALIVAGGLCTAAFMVGYGLYHADPLLLVAGVCGAIGWSGVALWLLVFDPKPNE